jgi:YesN/AraC family two-component response regulator
MKILLIEDNEADREVVINHVNSIESHEKLELTECDCLNLGLDQISENSYDIIILDLCLPETKGLETVQTTIDHIKKQNKQIPIIILTGLDDFDIGRKAWELGVEDYLIKDEIQKEDVSRALTFASYSTKDIKKKSAII